MNRITALNEIKHTIDNHWDIIIIGGGATGVGIAYNAIQKGYRTLLLEKEDFGSGTSSKSTKLIHGGIRYLQHGDFDLVKEALHERETLLEIAPHVVHSLPIVIPFSNRIKGWYYGMGTSLYDVFASSEKFKTSSSISKDETLHLLPYLNQAKVKGGILFYDGQFDDTRLLIDTTKTIAMEGGYFLNYAKVTKLHKNSQQKINRLTFLDTISNEEITLKSRCIINATGTFSDEISTLDNIDHKPIVTFARGTHITLSKKHFNTNTGMLIPTTSDGRVLFILPWNNHFIVGTTDIKQDTPENHPQIKPEEIELILTNLNQYLEKPVTREDILAVFCGIRPLVSEKSIEETKKLSRHHRITLSSSDLISVTGGKWTTFRKMGQDTIDFAIEKGLISNTQTTRGQFPIFGSSEIKTKTKKDFFLVSDSKYKEEIELENESLAKLLHPDFAYTYSDIVVAVRKEMAVTLEDVLARRLRILFLNYKVACELAPKVVKLIAAELDQNEEWEKNQLEVFYTEAEKYSIDSIDKKHIEN